MAFASPAQQPKRPGAPMAATAPAAPLPLSARNSSTRLSRYGEIQSVSRAKTERWREKGMQRWPDLAVDKGNKTLSFFNKSEEVVSMRRYQDNARQAHVTQELFLRSLRMPSLDMKTIGIGDSQKQWCAPNITESFSPRGDGWSGKANTHWKPKKSPDTDWIDRPVAVGKYSLDHDKGKRYKMNTQTRPCVPNSMAHTGALDSPPSARSPRSPRDSHTLRSSGGLPYDDRRSGIASRYLDEALPHSAR